MLSISGLTFLMLKILTNLAKGSEYLGMMRTLFLISCLSQVCFVISPLVEYGVIYSVTTRWLCIWEEFHFHGNPSMYGWLFIWVFPSYGNSAVINHIMISFIIFVDIHLPKNGVVLYFSFIFSFLYTISVDVCRFSQIEHIVQNKRVYS